MSCKESCLKEAFLVLVVLNKAPNLLVLGDFPVVALSTKGLKYKSFEDKATWTSSCSCPCDKKLE